MNTKRILSLTNELNSRQEEYTKINEQLAEQSKIIKNLKDVIEYRESQIEGLKLK
ncbi:hypothetical protein [Halarcobacter sp.]|uniref:hypothetical protein n=1 Tax=Halarcobacter sp. TaxID=2321133 RepID=UPI002AAAB875|nr:hypothetical protein [Halarcobacter sp.]